MPKIVQIEKDEVLKALIDDRNVCAYRFDGFISRLWIKPIWEIKEILKENAVYFYVEDSAECSGCFGASFNDCENCEDRKGGAK